MNTQIRTLCCQTRRDEGLVMSETVPRNALQNPFLLVMSRDQTPALRLPVRHFTSPPQEKSEPATSEVDNLGNT